MGLGLEQKQYCVAEGEASRRGAMAILAAMTGCDEVGRREATWLGLGLGLKLGLGLGLRLGLGLGLGLGLRLGLGLGLGLG